MGGRPVNSEHLPLPSCAHQIEQARKQRLRPAGNVIVSFVGLTPWDGYHVHCESGKRYRWAWSEDLPLVIVMKPGIDAGDAIRGCFWPANAHTLLTLIDIERQRVSFVTALLPKPVLWHRKNVTDYFPSEQTWN